MSRRISSSRQSKRLEVNLKVQSLESCYDFVKILGDGAFGQVTLARHKQYDRKGKVVAIKSMKEPMSERNKCFHSGEITCLSLLPLHPTIISVVESFHDEQGFCHMVMEHMEQNLYQLIKSRKKRRFDVATIRVILSQVLLGLEHCHKNKFFHRDIKPENILVNRASFPETRSLYSHYPKGCTNGVNYIVKLADFGLAQTITSEEYKPDYISTRWYRAPELLLRGSHSSPVDIWAFAITAAELVLLSPLLPGENEVDQVYRICRLRGSPGRWTRNGKRVGGGEWSEAASLAARVEFKFPVVPPMELHDRLGIHWPLSLIDMLDACLSWNPKARSTALSALESKFFTATSDRASIKEAVTPDQAQRLAGDKVTARYRERKQRRWGFVPGTPSPEPNPIYETPNFSVQPEGRPKTFITVDTCTVYRETDKGNYDKEEKAPGAALRQSWFARKQNSLMTRFESSVNITPGTPKLSGKSRGHGQKIEREQLQAPRLQAACAWHGQAVDVGTFLSPLPNDTPVGTSDTEARSPLRVKLTRALSKTSSQVSLSEPALPSSRSAGFSGFLQQFRKRPRHFRAHLNGPRMVESNEDNISGQYDMEAMYPLVQDTVSYTGPMLPPPQPMGRSKIQMPIPVRHLQHGRRQYEAPSFRFPITPRSVGQSPRTHIDSRCHERFEERWPRRVQQKGYMTAEFNQLPSAKFLGQSTLEALSANQSLHFGSQSNYEDTRLLYQHGRLPFPSPPAEKTRHTFFRRAIF